MIHIKMPILLFTTNTCGHCRSLISSPQIQNLQARGMLRIIDLHSIPNQTREQIFAQYNNGRSVPFLVYDMNGRYYSVVGKDAILNILS